MSTRLDENYDPPIAEVDTEGKVRIKTIQQRLLTLGVVKSIYGESRSLRAAEDYLMASAGAAGKADRSR